MIKNTIINKDALSGLKTLPDKSINMVMTSPPYWGLRDYGEGTETQWDDWKGQLGLEPYFNLYIKHLCDIFDETKRVLRDDGTIWVNIGDTYGGSGGASGHTEETKNLGYTTSKMGAVSSGSKTYQSKCLVMIPFRFAIEMVNRGWILRNTIIWHKRNCMPSSVSDRFTVDFEYLFFFSKNRKYYFEQQLEPNSEETVKDFLSRKKRGMTRWGTGNKSKNWNSGLDADKSGRSREEFYNPQGRNKRTTWTINPKPFPDAHFAVYPQELCETPIKAGCPKQVCTKCGKPKIKKYDSKTIKKKLTRESKKILNVRPDGYQRPPTDWLGKERKSLGYQPTCNCNADFEPGIVLDPFVGSGTTCLVAKKLNRNYIGIEISPTYTKMSRKRLANYTSLNEWL